MPITINGSGTVTGISAGGLPDDSIIAADIAAGAVTTAKIADANITAAKLDGAQSGSAPIYAARAWVNYNGSTPSIRASGNVSSVTKNATGDYTYNFTTSMPDTNYSVVGTTGDTGTALGSSANAAPMVKTFSTSSVRVLYGYGTSNTANDWSNNCIAIFR